MRMNWPVWKKEVRSRTHYELRVSASVLLLSLTLSSCFSGSEDSLSVEEVTDESPPVASSTENTEDDQKTEFLTPVASEASCLSYMQSAESAESMLSQEAFQELTLEVCPDVETWYNSLMQYPSAFGGEKVLDNQLELYCVRFDGTNPGLCKSDNLVMENLDNGTDLDSPIPFQALGETVTVQELTRHILLYGLCDNGGSGSDGIALVEETSNGTTVLCNNWLEFAVFNSPEDMVDYLMVVCNLSEASQLEETLLATPNVMVRTQLNFGFIDLHSPAAFSLGASKRLPVLELCREL